MVARAAAENERRRAVLIGISQMAWIGVNVEPAAVRGGMEDAMAFNVMDHPLVMEDPKWLTADSAWVEHLPMVPVILQLLRPRVFVELGTHGGDSYMGFCEACLRLGLETRCTAVDTWRGDAHTGLYDERIYRDLEREHRKHYQGFSYLYRGTFDAAAGEFAEGSVDLLHIDGLHTYEAVKHDVETWRPKMSRRGVMLLHDTMEQGRGFGVWRLWEELAAGRPQFNVPYGHGLGMVAVGDEAPAAFLEFLRELTADGERILAVFRAIGRRNELARNCAVLAAGLSDCQQAVNQWRRGVGQPLGNAAPTLQATLHYPREATDNLLRETYELVQDAVQVTNDMVRLRDGGQG